MTKILTVALLLLSTVGRGYADTKDQESVARAQFTAGRSYYDQANYVDALKAFNESYRSSKRPVLLYNIALCQERLGQLPEAVATLERYVQLDKTERAVIEARIANLKSQMEAGKKSAGNSEMVVLEPNLDAKDPETAPSAAPQLSTQSSSDRKPIYKKAWFWGVLAGAAVVAGVGVGVGVALGSGSAGASFNGNLPQGGPGLHASLSF
jgi:tetratricopeptide (TPR) repeat protein